MFSSELRPWMIGKIIRIFREDEMNKFLENLRNLHSNIAKDVYPNGGWLHCKSCDRWEKYSTDNAAYYLAHGWPRCCNHDMTTTEARNDIEPQDN